MVDTMQVTEVGGGSIVIKANGLLTLATLIGRSTRWAATGWKMNECHDDVDSLSRFVELRLGGRYRKLVLSVSRWDECKEGQNSSLGDDIITMAAPALDNDENMQGGNVEVYHLKAPSTANCSSLVCSLTRLSMTQLLDSDSQALECQSLAVSPLEMFMTPL